MKRMTYFENGKNRLRFNGVEYSGEFVDRLAALYLWSDVRIVDMKYQINMREN